MCGICLIIGGLPIEKHQIEFDFFEQYLCKNKTVLNEHIINNKLTLPQTINPIHISNKLSQRGPDILAIHSIDLYKTNYKTVSIKEFRREYVINKGQALGIQSIRHLRGKNFHLPDTPGSYFLFDGEIWDTGSLSGFEKDQNDGKWFHQMLIQCKGCKQKMLECLKQIRGDFVFILLQGEQLFIGKDYFGKKSLLIGMGTDYLAISSIPLQQVSSFPEEKQKDDQEDDNQCSQKTKYQTEWLTSKNKNMFQIPPNSLINIEIRNGSTLWSFNKIHQLDLKTIPKQLSNHQQMIRGCVKKALIESVKELTRCIMGLGEKEQKQAKIAVLFSGGVDSTLIARMLDMVLPDNEQIDLINLAFRQDAPDRETGKTSYQQLRMLNPNRKYNLILKDHTLNDVNKVQKQLTHTIYPKTSHMDLTIATALYFASNSNPRIVLSGLGADQIFGGYSRYKIAYKRAGYTELQNQMIFDMERLWIRNLGRDDRAIGSLGKEVRYPFLYLPLWHYLRTIQVSQITQGNGDKQLLRKIAKDFGLLKASTTKKKTIQFGTRLTKFSNTKGFGNSKRSKALPNISD